MMSKADVMRDDWKYLGLYDQYKCMREKRIKYREVVRQLSLDYGISESSVERIVRRLSKDC